MTLQRRSIDPRHQYRRWIDPRVWCLRVADVEAYLVRRGWTLVTSSRPSFHAFEEPVRTGESRRYAQLVPLLEQADDYPQRMFELITGVAEFEERQAAEILDDILRAQGTNGEPAHSANQAGAT